MRNLTIISLIIITLISCKSTKNSDDSIYFGGKIKNPKSKYVFLMKGDDIIDTLLIKSNNTFSKRIDEISEGLYVFKHGPEFQYIYFEPKDSISIRLNTWDFDESLVFSGNGSEKNNFLINLYLENEKNEKTYSRYYNLKSEEFSNKIKNTTSINNHFYEQLLNSGVELTGRFKKLAEVATNFSLYRQKEIYPYVHKNRFQLDNYPELPKDYYDFRSGIDLNDQNLIDYYPYHNYVSSYLYSKVHMDRDENISFTEQMLREIIKTITIDKFKNHLLYQSMYNDFREAEKSCAINKKALTIFNNHCTNQKYISQINKLADDCEKIKYKSPIKDFEIATFTGSKTRLNRIIKNQKSVIYFWSPEIMSQDMLVKRVKRLNEKFPSLLFVGINMKPELKSTKVYNSLKNQYKLTENSQAKDFIKSLEPRTILVNQNGVISNSFTYLSSPHLEKQLTKLLEK